MGQNEDERRTRNSNKAYDKWVGGISRAVISIEEYAEEIQEERPTLTEVKIKCDPSDERGVLVILRGYLIDKQMVAFHRDVTVTGALTGAGNRLRNGTVSWREEEPYGAK